ncbi:hypothetical protein KLP40_15445 [Hymenobacter sp. NST-14]|uniref:GDSL-type esterase/lipase family protein n=1 Tax=Hymenobacter piscis TaxID=2839984 RepID=UPI001C02B887|nr:GDSL-type esterase/lipase family protein [Hymenobacter piscis]MBT9394565.1 hypothetical protein [Hymenobacter piscis]
MKPYRRLFSIPSVAVGVLFSLVTGCASAPLPAAAPALNPGQWTGELRAFARQDSLTPPPAHPILFYGSSSVRKWETMGQDFPTHPVLNRGFGGSRFPDALHYFDQLVVAYQPRQVVLYEGDNDLAAGATPEAVYQSFRRFERRMRRQLPRVPLVFLAIKPSPARWALYPQMQEANRRIRAYIEAHPQRLRYVDTATPLLGPNGRPRPAFYVADSLHMTPAGYAQWQRVLEPALVR